MRGILVKLESPALEAMALFAFVIKDARQYLKMMNHIQGETLVEQRLEPAHDICFDKRIVYGFLKGRFSIEEMNSFFEDFADCAGVAPKAKGYFQYFNRGMELHTGGLSIQNISDLQPGIHDNIMEFTNGKLLDEEAFNRVKQTWFEALRNSHAQNIS